MHLRSGYAYWRGPTPFNLEELPQELYELILVQLSTSAILAFHGTDKYNRARVQETFEKSLVITRYLRLTHRSVRNSRQLPDSLRTAVQTLKLEFGQSREKINVINLEHCYRCHLAYH